MLPGKTRTLTGNARRSSTRAMALLSLRADVCTSAKMLVSLRGRRRNMLITHPLPYYRRHRPLVPPAAAATTSHHPARTTPRHITLHHSARLHSPPPPPPLIPALCHGPSSLTSNH